jgi:ParB family chromosome partitioning protein
MKKASAQLSVVSEQENAVEVREISVDELLLSLEETRLTIDQAALEELASSIRKKGVIEALLVRPIGDVFEIVAGQRRWLASKLAGKQTCPCVVRRMSEEEAAELRVISNLQRENLPPMEEAEAYGRLLQRPGATIETVAAALAKTPSYVGRRLQLLKAVEPVRDALKAGAIDVGHALELARLSDRMQSDLLAQLRVGGTSIGPNDVEDETGEPGTCRFCGCTERKPCKGGCSWANDEETICDAQECLARFRAEIGEESQPTWQRTGASVVELRGWIERQSLRILSNAPFPLDVDLAPMPCTDCPKRSTNAALLFDDCAQDTCTDRRCYDAKVGAWIQAELEDAKTRQLPLLKLTSNWSSDKDRIQVSDYSGAKLVAGDHECDSEEEGIWTDGEKVGRRAIICRNKNCKTHYGARASSGSSGYERPKKTEKEKEERSKLLVKVKAAKEYRAALAAKIAAVASFKADALETLHVDVCCALIEKTNSLYAAHLAKAIGWDEKLFDYGGRVKLRAKVTELPPATRMVIARLCEEAGELSVTEYNVNGKCEDLEKLARLVGIDPKKARAAATEPPAKKAILSAAAKKRIAEAQKKRWAAAKKKAGRK